jgi:hypothetical protein
VIIVDESNTSDRFEARRAGSEHERTINHSITAFGSALLIAESCDCGGVFGGKGSPLLDTRCFLYGGSFCRSEHMKINESLSKVDQSYLDFHCS